MANPTNASRIRRVRSILAARTERCDPSCPGWIVSEGNHGLQVERCDDCASLNGYELYDEDVRRLPEARAERRRTLRGAP